VIIVASLIVGLFAGVLSGLFGIGGGLVIVPAMVALGLTQKQAIATSLTALILPVGVLGVIEYAKHGDIKWSQALAVAGGLVFGVFLGAKLGVQVNDAVLRRLFGILLLVVGLRFLLWPN
jgi:uncharacterized protein